MTYLTMKGFNKTTPPRLPLCFTANTAGSTVKLNKNWNPTSVTLETSTNWKNWSAYTFGDTITLSNIGDKVYFRNTSQTDTRFSTGSGDYYKFVMTGSIAWSWDITSLLNKNWTNTLSNYCFYLLFDSCSSLTTAPLLPATNLADFCYYLMFYKCSSLPSLPTLPATTLKTYCYWSMFNWCTNIKLSTTQTWAYQKEYRIPITWTWTDSAGNACSYMFNWTGWTFKWTPSINTTYYTSNTLV